MSYRHNGAFVQITSPGWHLVASSKENLSRICKYDPTDIATTEDLESPQCDCLIHSPKSRSIIVEPSKSSQLDYKFGGNYER